VEQILRRSRALEGLSAEELRQRACELRWQAKTGVPAKRLLVEAYALVRETARRVAGLEHFPVQVLGGIAMFHGYIVEMQTGEGKTITATLPAFLRALPGRGCHVVTVNDYLANRDAENNRKIFGLLGLTVGCVLSDTDEAGRRQAYACDITYGTAKEFGFDFLRDRLKEDAKRQSASADQPWGDAAGPVQDGPVQRGHEFALIDEADSVLIDEARTPLIIGISIPQKPSTVGLMRWARRTALDLVNETDYLFDPERRHAFLTDDGCRQVIFRKKPAVLDGVDMNTIYDYVERAITAELVYKRDRDYVVRNDEIVLVDESTGRLMEGRKWQELVHQAVEAKERLPITAATGEAARMTVQTYFRRYRHLAGMTGTAVQARRELRRAYRLSVAVIPTHRPCLRKGLAVRVFATQAAKRQAVVEEIQALVAQGRAVLVGTPSVEASEALSAVLTQQQIEHETLNARQHAREAAIVAKAGQTGRVTIATNMAGRGTDILLDATVRGAGGLHVVATEMHSSKRIDRQLVGRAARQGDPGSFQFFLSLEDELLRCLPAKVVAAWRRKAPAASHGELPSAWSSGFRGAQRRLERQHAEQRKRLLKAEKERQKRHRQMGLDPYLELTE
jgi:preprotein translocase subunit SecA